MQILIVLIRTTRLFDDCNGNLYYYSRDFLRNLSYLECEKGGFHNGELVTFVCTEKKCREEKNALGCSVCMDQEHASCLKFPLKMMYKQLYQRMDAKPTACGNHRNSKNTEKFPYEITDDQPSSLNEGINNEQQIMQQTLLNLVYSSRQQILESFLQTSNCLIENIRGLQRICISIFDNIQEQTLHKLTSQNEIKILLQNSLAPKSLDNLHSLLDSLFNLLPKDALLISDSLDYSSELTSLHENLRHFFKDISIKLSAKNDGILAQLKIQENYLIGLQQDQEIIATLGSKQKIDLTFSSTDKHPLISIVNPTTVKSNAGSSSNYKFVLTNSGLPTNSSTKFAFKMKIVGSQNWIAIGVALKNVIKTKNYSFGLSSGHGSYMISSNSGSWSNSEPENNNAVKSFDFANNSIVECTFDPIDGFIYFQLKDNPAKQYKLKIEKQKMNEDSYHPCVLFYYPNDEVELLYPYF